MSISYRVTPESYLLRARARLDEQTKAGLFYAAFELRCGIAARLQEYLDVRHDIAQKKRKGWRIPKLAADLERVFARHDKIVRITITPHGNPGHRAIIYFTPVTRRLQRMAGELGNLLHAQQQQRTDDDPWWDRQRGLLEDLYSELRTATTGVLLGPPLLHKRTGRVTMSTAFNDQAQADQYRRVIGEVGARAEIKVEYLDELPPGATEGLLLLPGTTPASSE